ncbi:MAG: hypothetical protein JKX68_12820 [Flavobacteriales bacterium]|nr:hypothetical protein [Flavobacteriales bacterium]
MKILKSAAGGLIAAILLIGVLFKSMHWPGAGPMIVLGSSSLAMYVILVSGFIKFSPLTPGEQMRMFGSKKWILSLSTSVLIIGLLFKSMHWPGAGPMLVVGFGSLALVCLLYIFAFIVKKEEFKVTPPLFFIVIGISAMFFGVSVSGVSGFVIRGISDNAIGLESISKTVYTQNTTLMYLILLNTAKKCLLLQLN